MKGSLSFDASFVTLRVPLFEGCARHYLKETSRRASTDGDTNTPPITPKNGRRGNGKVVGSRIHRKPADSFDAFGAAGFCKSRHERRGKKPARAALWLGNRRFFGQVCPGQFVFLYTIEANKLLPPMKHFPVSFVL